MAAIEDEKVMSTGRLRREVSLFPGAALRRSVQTDQGECPLSLPPPVTPFIHSGLASAEAQPLRPSLTPTYVLTLHLPPKYVDGMCHKARSWWLIAAARLLPERALLSRSELNDYQNLVFISWKRKIRTFVYVGWGAGIGRLGHIWHCSGLTPGLHSGITPGKIEPWCKANALPLS